jgi:hypothetical protein
MESACGRAAGCSAPASATSSPRSLGLRAPAPTTWMATASLASAAGWEAPTVTAWRKSPASPSSVEARILTQSRIGKERNSRETPWRGWNGALAARSPSLRARWLRHPRGSPRPLITATIPSSVSRRWPWAPSSVRHLPAHGSARRHPAARADGDPDPQRRKGGVHLDAKEPLTPEAAITVPATGLRPQAHVRRGSHTARVTPQKDGRFKSVGISRCRFVDRPTRQAATSSREGHDADASTRVVVGRLPGGRAVRLALDPAGVEVDVATFAPGPSAHPSLPGQRRPAHTPHGQKRPTIPRYRKYWRRSSLVSWSGGLRKCAASWRTDRT